MSVRVRTPIRPAANKRDGKVQILESSDLGLRAARISLTHDDHPVSFTLFPMVHLGEQTYFEAVGRDVRTHDTAFVEGVGPSRIVDLITASYRWASAAPRLGLSVQSNNAVLTRGSLEVIHADLSADEFHRGWLAVPLVWRLGIYALAPLIGLQRRFVSSRADIADGMSMNDLTPRREHLSWDATVEHLNRAILHARDERLIGAIDDFLDRDLSERRQAAVVFGAGHMRAVLRHLIGERGYRVDATEWMTVFGL